MSSAAEQEAVAGARPAGDGRTAADRRATADGRPAVVVTGADRTMTMFVDAAPDADTVLAAVRTALADRLPAYSRPDEVRARSPLPTNSRGKVDRTRLEELAARPEPQETPA